MSTWRIFRGEADTMQSMDVRWGTDSRPSGRSRTSRRVPAGRGTQFDPKNVKDGELKPRPMEDAIHVDQRRAAIGLPPLADYECLLREVYKAPAKS